MKRIKSNLKPLADARGLSVRQIARDIDYRFESVRQLYNDESRQFPRDLLDKVCNYFHCDISELLVLTEYEIEQKEPQE
ncbi:helix-turn-helix transcriptional regulator [Paenibacillus sp. ACRRX]|uniref:helix-turn-helix domain-containing protein n=1 Tax=Paenibacillus sp. ACRRX TaxID=2918206 RepID=UPI001EF54AA3|nr:helix-turn-helix transcriptional regulator [Paenibacillus sp. ACRRX]